MKAPRIVITGRPGSGKSTLFHNILSRLKARDYSIAGIHSPEVRVSGRRIGFKFVDLYSGKEAWLARRGYPSTIRVGAYGVVVDEATSLWREALENMSRADIVGIDEVGPMELRLPGFKRDLVEKVLCLDKPVILVIHYRLRDNDILGRLANAYRYVVSIENRVLLNKTVPEKVLMLVDEFYGKRG